MSVDYTLESNKGTKVNRKSVCFGSIEQQSSNIPISEGLKGIWYHLGPGTSYFENTSPEERMQMERFWQELGLEKYLKDKVDYYYDAKDNLTDIFFKADQVNTFEFVTFASIFRMKSDNRAFFTVYDPLVEAGYSALVAYLASLSISDNPLSTTTSINLVLKSAHQPLTCYHVNVPSVSYISAIISGKINPSKTFMAEEFKTRKKVSYDGRDNWWRGSGKGRDSNIFQDLCQVENQSLYAVNRLSKDKFFKTLDKLEQAI